MNGLTHTPKHQNLVELMLQPNGPQTLEHRPANGSSDLLLILAFISFALFGLIGGFVNNK